MSENRKQSRPIERISAGVGAALIGSAVAGMAITDHELNNTLASQDLQISSQDSYPHYTDSLQLKTVSPDNHSQDSLSKIPNYKSKITIRVKPSNAMSYEPKLVPQSSKLNAINSLFYTEQEQLIPLNLENLVVPVEVKKIMDNNATYIYPFGCSGFLVRDNKGIPVGDVTANHCLPRPSNQVIGSDGKVYLPESSEVRVYTGLSYDHLTQVGTIDRFLVPPAMDIQSDKLSIDIVIGAFQGQDIHKVIQAYRETKMKEYEISSQLKKGDVIYVSGWPVSQPNNSGAKRRQDFAMQLIGMEVTTDSNGDVFNSLTAAVAQDADGSDCSGGISGGQAFIYKDDQYHAIGITSTGLNLLANKDLSQVQANVLRDSIENKYGVDLSKAASICTFSYKMSTLARGASIAKVSTSYESIPGYVDSLIQKARDEFFDPNYVKTWVRGAIDLDPSGKGNWKMNPLIFYDNKSGGAVIGSYTDNSKDGLELDYLPDFKDQKFNESGVIDVFTNQNNTNGFINASGGQIFGQNIQNDPNTIEFIQNDPAFSIYFDDSTQSLQIIQYKHN